MYLLEMRARRACSSPATPALMPETHALVERVVCDTGRELDVALLPIGYAPRWKPGFRRGHLTPRTRYSSSRRSGRALDPVSLGNVPTTSPQRRTMRSIDCALDCYPRTADGHVHIVEPGESSSCTSRRPGKRSGVRNARLAVGDETNHRRAIDSSGPWCDCDRSSSSGAAALAVAQRILHPCRWSRDVRSLVSHFCDAARQSALIDTLSSTSLPRTALVHGRGSLELSTHGGHARPRRRCIAALIRAARAKRTW